MGDHSVQPGRGEAVAARDGHCAHENTEVFSQVVVWLRGEVVGGQWSVGGEW